MRTVFRIYELKSNVDLDLTNDTYSNYNVMCKVGYDYETYEDAEKEISRLLDEAVWENEYCIKKVYVR